MARRKKARRKKGGNTWWEAVLYRPRSGQVLRRRLVGERPPAPGRVPIGVALKAAQKARRLNAALVAVRPAPRPRRRKKK